MPDRPRCFDLLKEPKKSGRRRVTSRRPLLLAASRLLRPPTWRRPTSRCSATADVREIFLRLPSPAVLVRAALARRSFLRAARDADFLRRFRARHPSAPRLLGFLFVVPGGTPPVFLSAASVSASGPPPAGDFSLSFLPGGGWPSAEWEVVDCRDGLLLLRNEDATAMKLAVSDPSRRACCPIDLPIAAPAPAGNEDSSASFRVVCIARGRHSSTLRALVLSSDEPYWKEADALPCEASLAHAVWPMKAKASLYWRLDDGKRMVAFDAAPGKTKLSILDLPPFPPTLTFDVVDTEDDRDGLRVLTMRDFCLETWNLASGAGDGTTCWTLEDTSVRFYRALESMFGKRKLRRRSHEFEIVGVVDGFLFFRQSGILLSIDLKTMRLRRLSDQDCSPAMIYPYTKARAWPPSFLNPIE